MRCNMQHVLTLSLTETACEQLAHTVGRPRLHTMADTRQPGQDSKLMKTTNPTNTQQYLLRSTMPRMTGTRGPTGTRQQHLAAHKHCDERTCISPLPKH